MDRSTLAAYDSDAAAFAKDWHEQPAPVDLQDIVKRFFIKGGATADIGCGAGARWPGWMPTAIRHRASTRRKACSGRRAGDIRI